ncbi:glycosyltransferase [Ornithinimicrobium sp. LYQ92]|uniref:glycosyltransferase n=1 Tax=Serinicoccus sp. LYQ92 TaxID=3378798 RepID=UPI0038546B6C
MRVLVVTTWFPTPSSPATGIFVARDVAAVAARHEVVVLHLVAPSLAEPEAAGADLPPGPGGAVVERLVMDPRRPDQVLRAARRAAELAAGADVVHTMAISALLPFAVRRPRRPWVHTEHWSGLGAPETLTVPLRMARHAVRPLLARPDLVVVVGEELAGSVRALRAGPVRVVPNIVSAPSAPVPRRDPALALDERGPLEIIAVGGLIARKDPLTAVATTAELRRRRVDARLTWVGTGPLEQQVRALAEQLAVPLELTGPLVPEQVQDVLAGADLFLLPTRAETFCLAAAEALAAGRPVVVGDSGGPAAFVSAPAGALVAPGAGPATWADAVTSVWRGAADLSAEQIAADVRARYGEDRYADLMDEAYATTSDARSSWEQPPATPGRERGRGRGERGAQGERDDGDVRDVDLVIAVHSSRRQVERAVRSVFDGSPGVAVRVTLVAHNIAADEVRGALNEATRGDPRVRVLGLHDDIPSPSGPFMLGLDAATAPWAAIMGSDDTLAPGALAGWLAAAGGLDPDEPVAVVPPLQLAGRPVPTPQRRPGRTGRRRRLDLVADRLSYRSAPLGLLSRGALALPDARLLPGAPVGGDVPMVTALWSQARVVHAAGAPAYLIHEDAQDRVTYAPRPIREQLASIDALWDLPVTARLSPAQRQAVGTKVLRIHVFGAVPTRPEPAWWTPEERAELARVTARVLAAAPGCADPLSLADHDLLAAVLDPRIPADRLLGLALARRRHGTPRTLLPSSWRHVLHPEAPARFMAASLLAARR